MNDNERDQDAGWYLHGGAPKDFHVMVEVTAEQFNLILLARWLDGKSLKGLVQQGLEQQLEQLMARPDYQMALSLKKAHSLDVDNARALRAGASMQDLANEHTRAKQ